MTSSFQNTLFLLILLIATLLVCGCSKEDETVPGAVPTIPGPSIAEIEGITSNEGSFLMYDSIGRQVVVPKQISSVICSGEGCISLFTLLQVEDRIVGVDASEIVQTDQDFREYQHAYPKFSSLRVISGQDGNADPNRIQRISPLPDLIFLADNEKGYNPDELQRLTGIPVLVVRSGDLVEKQDEFEYSLRLMGIVLQVRTRAEDVIQFFRTLKENLKDRIAVLSDDTIRTAYVGGTSDGYPRDVLYTTPHYMPFVLAGVNQVPYSVTTNNQAGSPVHITLQELVAEQPQGVFIDLATLQNKDNAVTELQTYPTYTRITAISEGAVYGLLPSDRGASNYGSILANAYFIGKTLYPDKYTDVNPESMADDIFTFLYGKPLFYEMNTSLSEYAFHEIPLS